MMKKLIHYFVFIFCCSVIAACENQPYPTDEHGKNIYYTDFTESPKTLDPAQAYEEGEISFIAQIYEPPLQYDFIRRPYTLIPLTARQMPKIEYFNRLGEILPTPDSNQIAFTRYTINIQPGIYYAPHPAFAYQGQNLTPYLHGHIKSMEDFSFSATRELTADDYIYEIKRLASPRVSSPIFSVMAKYIVGLSDLQKSLMVLEKKYPDQFIDLRTLNLAGVKKIDPYTYQITIQGHYPQFIYWLAMPFFAPIPWEMDRFIHLPGMAENNLTLEWFPIGTGPYKMTVHNPNRRIELLRNPRFHGEMFPFAPPDSILHPLGGLALPLLNRVVFSLEREGIPRWNKFLQGYYD